MERGGDEREEREERRMDGKIYRHGLEFSSAWFSTCDVIVRHAM